MSELTEMEQTADREARHGHRELVEKLEARVAKLEGETGFLLSRLDEWSADNLTDANARDWLGHVEPSIDRIRTLLRKGGSDDGLR